MAKITNKQYAELVKKASPNSQKLLDFVKAFVTGGTICVLGQLLNTIYVNVGLSELEVKAAVPCTLIVISALLTAFGVYDNIASFGGAGALVPITGFSNAVVSPALEFKSEGYVLGTGAKLFTIAGPVIVYGTLTAVIYGVILVIVGY